MSNRAEFMKGKFGLMTHWLQSPVGPAAAAETSLGEQIKEWNDRVDAFDVKALAAQINQTGAAWFILTIGQNTGFYCSPNAVYDELTGYAESKCSRRDLFLDLAKELKQYDIKAIAYLPSGAPSNDEQATKRLEWTDGALRDEKGEMMRYSNGYRMYDKNHRLANFQIKWEKIVAQWAKGWGDLCAGWWIDGVYYADGMYRHDEAPNFHSFAAALRAGNPDAAICFNPGIYRVDNPKIQSEEEDYSAGELNSMLWTPFGRNKTPAEYAQGKLGTAQMHILSFLGGNWGLGSAPRYPQGLTIAYTKYLLDNGAGMTWDLPTSPTGEIPKSFMKILTAMGEALS